MKYLIRIAISYLYDLWIYLFADLKMRAACRNYNEYRIRRLYPRYLHEGAAMDGVEWLARRFCTGKGVDIGASKWPLQGARAIEDRPDENAYLIKENDNALDFIFSSHVLEHLDQPYHALEHWFSKLKVGGRVVLYLPHTACHMWRTTNLVFHKWNPNPWDLEDHCKKKFNCEVEYITYLPDGFLSFALVLRKSR